MWREAARSRPRRDALPLEGEVDPRCSDASSDRRRGTPTIRPDIIATPLGVQCTVVGVKDGSLYLKWPGNIVSAATCAPQKVHDKTGLEADLFAQTAGSVAVR